MVGRILELELSPDVARDQTEVALGSWQIHDLLVDARAGAGPGRSGREAESAPGQGRGGEGDSR